MAPHVLRSLVRRVDVTAIELDLDQDEIPRDIRPVDLCFSGFLVHELRDPHGTVVKMCRILNPRGLCVILDYVAGDVDSFVATMIRVDIDEDEARARYPRMCARDIGDLRSAGLVRVRSVRLDGHRAIALGEHVNVCV